MLGLSGWIRGQDPSRLLHYEGGGSRTTSTDIVCPMYMRIWDIVKIAEDPSETRPLILCEYGPLFRFWHVFIETLQHPFYPLLMPFDLLEDTWYSTICGAHLTGIHIPWGTATEILVITGKQLIAHLVSKEVLSGNGLIRLKALCVLMHHSSHYHIRSIVDNRDKNSWCHFKRLIIRLIIWKTVVFWYKYHNLWDL